jgi:hypothetical protein
MALHRRRRNPDGVAAMRRCVASAPMGFSHLLSILAGDSSDQHQHDPAGPDSDHPPPARVPAGLAAQPILGHSVASVHRNRKLWR